MDSSSSQSASSNSDSENYSECDDSHEDTCEDLEQCQGAQPYMFEPYETDASEGSEHSDHSDESEETPERLLNTDWCTCGNCQIMDRAEECICCKEIECVQTKLLEAVTVQECIEPPSCITKHPGFDAVCLNRWVLQTAWLQYKQQYKSTYDGPENKLNRHVAYRQLARWCWGILGKEIRVVLPACGVCCVRAHFPPPGDEEGYHFPDE